MKRRMVSAGALAALLLVGGGAVFAQGFKPSRNIEFVTHSGPGGGGDVFGRAIIAAMDKEKLMPARMQMVNKTGGSGATAMAYLAEKQGDTHTIAVFTSIWYTTPLMRAEARYSMKDMTPLVRLVLEPAVVAVKSDAPYKTLKDFIDAAQKNPGQLKQSGGSIGARDWVLQQLLMKHTGAKWSFISFPGGGERIAALLGGHVNLMILEPQEAGEHIRSGNMRVIAQVSDKRLPSLSNVPTVKEAGFDVPNVPQVRGIVAPPGIPAEAVAYWEDLFARLNQTASWRKFLEEQLLEDGLQRSAELAKFGDTFSDTMRGILKEAGVKVAR